MCVKALLSAICSERREPSTSCSGAISSGGWTLSTSVCLLTCAHKRGKEKDTEFCVAIVTETTITPHPNKAPPPLLGRCVVLSWFVCTSWWYNVTLEPREGSPTTSSTTATNAVTSSSSCRQENRPQLFCLSFICLCCVRPPACRAWRFYPRPESSTLPSIGWKGSYWEFSPEVVRQEIQSMCDSAWLCVCTHVRGVWRVALHHISPQESMSDGHMNGLIILMTQLQVCVSGPCVYSNVCACGPL